MSMINDPNETHVMRILQQSPSWKKQFKNFCQQFNTHLLYSYHNSK